MAVLTIRVRLRESSDPNGDGVIVEVLSSDPIPAVGAGQVLALGLQPLEAIRLAGQLLRDGRAAQDAVIARRGVLSASGDSVVVH